MMEIIVFFIPGIIYLFLFGISISVRNIIVGEVSFYDGEIFRTGNIVGGLGTLLLVSAFLYLDVPRTYENLAMATLFYPELLFCPLFAFLSFVVKPRNYYFHLTLSILIWVIATFGTLSVLVVVFSLVKS